MSRSLLTLFLLATPVAPAVHASDLDAFMKSLRQPDTGLSCCDWSDCAFRPARQRPDGTWEALSRGNYWTPIGPDALIRGKVSPDPDGRAILCETKAETLCFVPPFSGL